MHPMLELSLRAHKRAALRMVGPISPEESERARLVIEWARLMERARLCQTPANRAYFLNAAAKVRRQM